MAPIFSIANTTNKKMDDDNDDDDNDTDNDTNVNEDVDDNDNDNEDDDDEEIQLESNFSTILSHYMYPTTNRRDPRSVRLAAVTSALIDVITNETNGNSNSNSTSNSNNKNNYQNIVPSNLYAKCITTLEGTIQQNFNTNDTNDNNNSNTILDSLLTQVALLELLYGIIPYVEPIGILLATISLSSRIVKSLIIVSSTSLSSSITNDETIDGLGGTNSLVRWTMKVSTILIQRIMQVKENNTLLSKTIESLFNDTILTLFFDKRPKVRKCSQQCIIDLLSSSSTNKNNTIIKKSIVQFIKKELVQSLSLSSSTTSSKISTKNTNNVIIDNANTNNERLVHVLAFIEKICMYLDPTTVTNDIGTIIMDMLMNYLRFNINTTTATTSTTATAAMNDFVSIDAITIQPKNKIKNNNPIMICIISLLSTVNAIITSSTTADSSTGSNDFDNNVNNAIINQYSIRVIASLLQIKPSIIFTYGIADTDLLYKGRELFCTVLIQCCHQLLLVSPTDEKDMDKQTQQKSIQISSKLFPLTIQMILNLSCSDQYNNENDPNGNGNESDNNNETLTKSIFVELTQLFREKLSYYITNNKNNEYVLKSLQDAIKCFDSIIVPSNTTTTPIDLEYQSSLWSITVPCYILLLVQIHNNTNTSSTSTSSNSTIHTILQTSIESIIQLRSTVPTGSIEQKSIQDSISSLVQGIGIEETWKYIQWNNIDDNNNNTTKSSSKKNKASSSSVEGISIERAWILPIMKTAAIAVQSSQPRLGFFQSDVLPMARICDKLAVAAEAVVSAKTTTTTGTTTTKSDASGNKKTVTVLREIVIDVWSLFPCFCSSSPIDINDVLPSLDTILARALGDKRYPQLVSIICNGITILAQQHIDEQPEELRQHEELLESEDNNASTNESVSVIELTAIKLLPAMFKYITDSHASVSNEKNTLKIDGENPTPAATTTTAPYQYHQDVTKAITVLSCIAPKDFVYGLFKKVMQRLLEAIQAPQQQQQQSKSESTKTGIDIEKVCSLLSLSQALVSSKVLDETNVSFLFRAIKTMIKNDEHGTRIQKRSYKLLVEICVQYHTFVIHNDQLPDLISLLSDTIMTAQVAARHMRLKCMLVLGEGMNESNTNEMNAITKVLGEVLLCLKDANGKTREVAYQLIITIAKQGDMSILINVLAAALGAKTPHMRSAAVMALSRIIFECGNDNETLPPLLPSMLQTVLLLINEQSREVLKSVIGFIRVSVAAIPAYQLEPMIPDLVANLLKYHEAKGRFRAKIKIILKKLVKLFGYDRLMPYVPASDSRLLTHMRKLDEREKRRRLAGRAQQQNDRVQQSDDFDQLLESDEDDSDDGRTLMTGATGLTRLTGRKGEKSIADKSMAGSIASKSTKVTTKSRNQNAAANVQFQLPDETDGEVVDMLSSKIAKRVKFVDNSNNNNDNDSDDDDDDMAMEFDDDGKMIVPDDNDDDNKSKRGKAIVAVDDNFMPASRNKRQKLSSDASKASFGSKQNLTATTKSTNNNKNSNKKRGNNVDDSIGKAYKAKKAGGDVKRKGQVYDPYAYVPLDGRAYSKKNRQATVEKMASVVRKGGKRKR